MGQRWFKSRWVLGAVAILTLAFHYLIWPLGKDALIGWTNRQIAAVFGLKDPTIGDIGSSVLVWGLSLIAAIAVAYVLCRIGVIDAARRNLAPDSLPHNMSASEALTYGHRAEAAGQIGAWLIPGGLLPRIALARRIDAALHQLEGGMGLFAGLAELEVGIGSELEPLLLAGMAVGEQPHLAPRADAQAEGGEAFIPKIEAAGGGGLGVLHGLGGKLGGGHIRSLALRSRSAPGIRSRTVRIGYQFGYQRP